MHLAGIPAIGLAVSAGTAGAKVVGDFAGMLRSALTGGADETSPTNHATTTDRTSAAKIRGALSQLEQRIRTLLAGEGLPASGAMTLTQDVFDRIHVAGHPAAERIDGLLASNPEIGDQFRAIADAIGTLSPKERTGLPSVRDDEGKPTFELVLPDRSLVRDALP